MCQIWLVAVIMVCYLAGRLGGPSSQPDFEKLPKSGRSRGAMFIRTEPQSCNLAGRLGGPSSQPDFKKRKQFIVTVFCPLLEFDQGNSKREIYIYICMQFYMCRYIYVYIYKYIYICMCIYIHIYLWICIHIYSSCLFRILIHYY